MIKAAGVAEVTDADFGAEVIGSDLPVLVEFTADWCPPCRQMGPVLSELAFEEGDRFKVVQLDVDTNPETTHELPDVFLGVELRRTRRQRQER